MATRRAIANGNWSATATWNGGVVPGNGDTVYANGFNVTLDQDITIGGENNPTVSAGSFVSGQWYEVDFVGTTSWIGIGAASNTAGTVFLATGVGSGSGTAKALATLTTTNNTAAGAAAGGSFVMSTVRAINTDIRAGTTTCLNVTATSGTLTLSGLRVVGGSATGAHALICGTNSTVVIDSASVSSGGSGAGVRCAAANLAIQNSIIAASNSAVNTFAVQSDTTGTVSITNSTINGPGGTIGQGNPSVNNSGLGTLNISNSIITANSFAAVQNSAGTLVCTACIFSASSITNAVNLTSTSANVSLSGDFLDHWSGWRAVNGAKWRLGTTPSAARTRYALAGTKDSYVEMFTADNATFGQPAISDVRSGTVYGGGILTGTCAVPAASSVAFGVPVDNTVGTAVLTPAAIRAELATELGRIDAAISSRLAPSGTLATVTNLTNAPASVTPADIWSHASRTITGGSVDTLTNAPTVPSASAIASQVRTELGTELGRIDQNISSRLAAADYTAPSTAPSVVDIRTELDANSTKLANLDATISSRLADADYVAPTSAPTVADIRAELATELGRIDASISSRLADADYVAPTTPPTAAEIATAVEGSILNEGDGQQVLNAIVGAIGNSNVDEIALVAAIRSDLERAGGKLDSIPTTSAPSASTVAGAVRSELSVELARLDAPISGATAPSAATVASAVRSELSTELTKVSALNTDRLANCATTQIVGTLLAQSQS